MTSPAPIISFLIPVRNDAARLRGCLATISSAAGDLPFEIIVGDNGSTDGSADVAREAGAVVIALPDRGISEIRNLAAAAATADLLAFVDADHELAKEWTSAAVALFRDATVSAAGAQYHAPAGGTWVQRIYDRLRRRQPGVHATDWLPSGNLVVRRDAFEALGGFDTSLETCEDVDLCQRLRSAGGRLLAADALRSVHAGDPSTLKALFFGELWRGRDNLRVTLRAPLTLRSAVSLGFPLLGLAAIAALAIGLLALPWVGPWIAAAGAAVLAAIILVRTTTLVSRAPLGERGLRDVWRAMLVAATYDAARALALVARSGHGVRRKG